MAYAQGSVVVGPASLRGGRRPYLVVSNRERPFFGDEYTVAVVTTKERDDAIELTTESFAAGTLDRTPSYVNPWSLHVFQHEEIDRRVAQLEEPVVGTVAERIYEFVRPGGPAS